jgi:transposase
VRWLTAGLSRADIASRLGVGEETVKTHLTSVYRKLGVTGRYGVAALLTTSARGTPASTAATASRPGRRSAPTEPDAPSD